MKTLLYLDGSVSYYMEESQFSQLMQTYPVSIYREGEAACNGQYDNCIYLMGIQSGVSKAQCEFILSHKEIKYWYLVLLDNGQIGKSAFAAIKNKWEIYLKESSIVYKLQRVTPEQMLSEMAGWLDEQRQIMAVLKQYHNKQYVCAVYATKHCVGKERVIHYLEGQCPKWAFINIDPYEIDKLKQYQNIAQSILLIGKDIGDFQVECLKESRLKTWLLLNKADESPIFYCHKDLTKESVTYELNRCHWGVGTSYSQRIFVGSVLFEEQEQAFKQKQIPVSTFLESSQCVMFDQYGLPLLRGEYNEEYFLKWNAQNELKLLVQKFI